MQEPPPQWSQLPNRYANYSMPPSPYPYQVPMQTPPQKFQRPINANFKTAAILLFFLAFTCGLFGVANSGWIVLAGLLQIAAFICVCLI